MCRLRTVLTSGVRLLSPLRPTEIQFCCYCGRMGPPRRSATRSVPENVPPNLKSSGALGRIASWRRHSGPGGFDCGGGASGGGASGGGAGGAGGAPAGGAPAGGATSKGSSESGGAGTGVGGANAARAAAGGRAGDSSAGASSVGAGSAATGAAVQATTSHRVRPVPLLLPPCFHSATPSHKHIRLRFVWRRLPRRAVPASRKERQEPLRCFHRRIRAIGRHGCTTTYIRTTSVTSYSAARCTKPSARCSRRKSAHVQPFELPTEGRTA
jgi:hypothetical protein